MPEFTPIRIERSYVQQFEAPPDRVFPLLCPVREYEWIEPWKCELLRSDSGFAEKNCVFRTRFASDSSDETWVISCYEPNTRIEFVRFNPLRVMCYSILLARDRDGTTSATNKQVLTALSPEGNRSLDALTEEGFVMELRIGEAMLNHYLATGKMLPLTEAMARARQPR